MSIAHFENLTIDGLVSGIATLLQSAGKNTRMKARLIGFHGEQIADLRTRVLERQQEIADESLRREVLTVLAGLDDCLGFPPTDRASEAVTYFPGFQHARDLCADDLARLARRIKAERWAGGGMQGENPVNGDGALQPMTQKQLVEAIQCGEGTIRGWARTAKVSPRKNQGDSYSVDEVVAILRVGSSKSSSYAGYARDLLGE